MSTIPTEITAATESPLDIASIKSVMDGFDPASLLPDLSKVFGSLVGVCRDRKSTRLNSSHVSESRMPSSA